MGNRYYLTGIQLGMIEAFSLDNKQVIDLIKEIEDKQYLGDKDNFTQEHLKQKILNIINQDRDNGNIENEKGFSPALCLSKLIKELEK